MTVAPTPLHERRAPHGYALLLAAAFVLVAVVVAVLIRYDVFQGSSGSTGVQGSGIAATQTRNLAAFSGVELAGANNVTVRVGGQRSVVVHADDNLLGHVTTRVDAGSLVIGNTSGSLAARSPLRVEVNMPSLEALKLSGSGVVSVTGIKAKGLTVILSGAGVLRASGSATRVDVTLGGSGDAQLKGLVARDVHAVVSGSGRILVTATESLDASVPGAGAIVYSGNPAQVTTNITGSGAVVRG